MRLSDLGEEALIEHIVRKFGLPTQGKGLVVGEGDDAAVLECDGDKLALVTTDMLAEGVHYRADIITPFQLGWKAIASNISDIGAMGGRATWALVAIGLKSGTELDFVDQMYEGMVACARRFGSEIIGGDTIAVSNGSIIAVTQLGEVCRECLALRSGAKPGDRLLVTGWLGNSAAGLRLLLNYGVDEASRLSGWLVSAHLMPTPRIIEGQAGANTGAVHAMMDLSDGLGADLPKLCRASGVGAVVFADRIPISKDLYDAADVLKVNPLDLALEGGEDYELLIATSAEDVPKVCEAVEASTGTTVSEIGEVIEETSVEIAYPDGARKALQGGWQHFSLDG